MKYYRLVSQDNGENILMRRVSNPEVHTTGGDWIDGSKMSLPIEIEMYVGDDYGYDQYDPDFEGDVEELSVEDRLLDYCDLPCLMTLRLVSVLKSEGVDNIQTFPVKIANADTGEELNQEYQFVNVIGVMSCADPDNSEQDSIGNTFYFHDLKIDEGMTHGLPVFRLAESPSEIIVNESVALAIRAGGFKGVGVIAVN